MKFTEKYQKNQYGTDVDLSELTLEHEETKEQLTLVKEKIAMSPESVATFVYTWGERREFQVRKDQEFSLKPEEQIKYKLVDVQAGQGSDREHAKTRRADRDRSASTVRTMHMKRNLPQGAGSRRSVARV